MFELFIFVWEGYLSLLPKLMWKWQN